MNKEKGITLVALIITIIVLLILATVSISLIINEGIINKAKYGVDKYSEEEELEQIKLAVLSARMSGDGRLMTENLNKELQVNFNNEETVTEYPDFYIYKSKNNYKIYKSGNIKKGLLPEEYKECEYLESTGSQYINTEFYRSKEYPLKVETCIWFTDPSKGDSLNGDHSNFFFGVRSNKIFRTEWNIIDNFVNYSISVQYPYYTQSMDDLIVTYQEGWYADTIQQKNPICFFGTEARGTRYYLGYEKIKSFKMSNWKTGEILYDFIPCLDNNNKPCMYDLVSQKSFYNSGTNEFLYKLK